MGGAGCHSRNTGHRHVHVNRQDPAKKRTIHVHQHGTSTLFIASQRIHYCFHQTRPHSLLCTVFSSSPNNLHCRVEQSAGLFTGLLGVRALAKRLVQGCRVSGSQSILYRVKLRVLNTSTEETSHLSLRGLRSCLRANTVSRENRQVKVKGANRQSTVPVPPPPKKYEPAHRQLTFYSQNETAATHYSRGDFCARCSEWLKTRRRGSGIPAHHIHELRV